MSVEESALMKFIAPLVTAKVMPKIKDLIDTESLKIEKFHHDLYKNRFEEYLLRRYESFLTIDTLVLQNQQVPFKSLYLPLTLIGREKQNYIQFEIDGYKDEFIPVYFRVLVVDSAGMGKSTILKKLFLSAIEENGPIPIFIELRKLNKKNTLLNEIYKQLNPLHKELSKEFILSLISRGDFLFLFDGFDEIPIDDKDDVIKNIHEFIEKANGNYFVMSSRPEDSLVSFSDFKKFNIQPLHKQQAYKLLRLYAQNDYKSNSDDLIEILERKENRSVHEFLTNPLLVSLLYSAFDYGKEVPIEKAQFYSLVYDALYHRHDLTKEGYFRRQKYSRLHRDNFEKILRGIGYISFKEGKIEFRKSSILEFIKRAKKKYKLDFSPSDFFEDLIKTVPLFQKDGNFYKWSHKSLQDYFAARFIVLDTGEKRKNVLIGLFKSKEIAKYENIFELCYYLDYKLYRNSIIHTFLDQFVNATEKFLEDKNDDLGYYKDIFEMTYDSTLYYLNSIPIILIYKSDAQPEIFKTNLQEFMMQYYGMYVDSGEVVKNIHGLTFDICYDTKGYQPPMPYGILRTIGKKYPDIIIEVKESSDYKNVSIDFCKILSEQIEKNSDKYTTIDNHTPPKWIFDDYIEDYLTVIKRITSFKMNYNYCRNILTNIESEITEENNKEDFI